MAVLIEGSLPRNRARSARCGNLRSIAPPRAAPESRFASTSRL